MFSKLCGRKNNHKICRTSLKNVYFVIFSCTNNYNKVGTNWYITVNAFNLKLLRPFILWSMFSLKMFQWNIWEFINLTKMSVCFITSVYLVYYLKILLQNFFKTFLYIKIMQKPCWIIISVFGFLLYPTQVTTAKKINKIKFTKIN